MVGIISATIERGFRASFRHGLRAWKAGHPRPEGPPARSATLDRLRSMVVLALIAVAGALGAIGTPVAGAPPDTSAIETLIGPPSSRFT